MRLLIFNANIIPDQQPISEDFRIIIITLPPFEPLLNAYGLELEV